MRLWSRLPRLSPIYASLSLSKCLAKAIEHCQKCSRFNLFELRSISCLLVRNNAYFVIISMQSQTLNTTHVCIDCRPMCVSFGISPLLCCLAKALQNRQKKSLSFQVSEYTLYTITVQTFQSVCKTHTWKEMVTPSQWQSVLTLQYIKPNSVIMRILSSFRCNPKPSTPRTFASIVAPCASVSAFHLHCADLPKRFPHSWFHGCRPMCVSIVIRPSVCRPTDPLVIHLHAWI